MVITLNVIGPLCPFVLKKNEAYPVFISSSDSSVSDDACTVIVPSGVSPLANATVTWEKTTFINPLPDNKF